MAPRVWISQVKTNKDTTTTTILSEHKHSNSAPLTYKKPFEARPPTTAERENISRFLSETRKTHKNRHLTAPVWTFNEIHPTTEDQNVIDRILTKLHNGLFTGINHPIIQRPRLWKIT